MQSFRDIINAWPSRASLAGDRSVALETVHKWFQRNSIPPEHDLGLVAAARGRGICLSLEAIAAIRAKTAAQDNGQPVRVCQGGTFAKRESGEDAA